MRQCTTSNLRPAFSLMELLVTITIMAAVGATLVPSLTSDEQVRLIAASSIIASDIELAQVMTISYPDDPVVVVFNPGKGQYHLAYADDPDTPINRLGTNQPYEVLLGEGRAGSALGVTFTVVDMPSNTLTFNEQGGLADLTTEPYVVLTINGETLALQIATTTGTIMESGDVPADPKDDGGTSDDDGEAPKEADDKGLLGEIVDLVL